MHKSDVLRSVYSTLASFLSTLGKYQQYTFGSISDI